MDNNTPTIQKKALTLTAFKKEIKGYKGKRYACTATNLHTGVTKFTLPIRELKWVDTVKIGFASHNHEGDISYADFPLAKEFSGDCKQFSFSHEAASIRLTYTLMD